MNIMRSHFLHFTRELLVFVCQMGSLPLVLLLVLRFKLLSLSLAVTNTTMNMKFTIKLHSAKQKKQIYRFTLVAQAGGLFMTMERSQTIVLIFNKFHFKCMPLNVI